jgi:lipopolysaccharide exporter
MPLKDTYKTILKLFNLEKIRKNSFAVDSSKVVIGTILSQAISVLSIPILSRIYTPESIGETGVFLAIIAVLSMVACGRYECAVMLPEKEEEGMAVLCVSFFFCVAFSIFSFIVCQELIYLNVQYITTQSLQLIPIAMFLNGFSNAMSFWILRYRKFWLISIAKLTSGFATVLIQITLGLGGHNTALSLLTGIVAGYLVLFIMYSIILLYFHAKLLGRVCKFDLIISTCYRYRRFPLIDFWSAVLDNGAGQIPIFILKRFFSIAQVGHYTMAMRVLSLPCGLIAASISQVFFQRASEMRRQGKGIADFAENIYMKIVYVGLPPLLLITMMGQYLFTLILGEQWSISGQLCQIMAPALFFALLFSPLSSIVVVCERQRASLIARILMLLIAVIPLSVIIHFYPHDIFIAILTLSISQGFLYLILSQWNLRIARDLKFE